jgi:3-hydroxyacyl-CoA dehydrogenase
MMLAATGKRAPHARELGSLTHCDVMHADELLHVAKVQAGALTDRSPSPIAETLPVLGRAGINNFEAAMSNTNAGGFISEHDQRIGLAIARALCGGEVDTGTRVDE